MFASPSFRRYHKVVVWLAPCLARVGFFPVFLPLRASNIDLYAPAPKSRKKAQEQSKMAIKARRGNT